MSGLMKTTLLWATLVLTALLRGAAAQDYPLRPITVIVPTATGGLTDVLTRNIMQRLSQAWGQSIVIENRGGAGHNIGAAAVAKAPPDGYTLMAVEAGTFVANPFLYAKLPYDAERDFEPISGFASVPMALLAHPSVRARDVRELIALAKQKPREISYGTSGIGGSLHISILLLETLTDAKLVPVHYRGAAPALNDLLGGHINLISMGPLSRCRRSEPDSLTCWRSEAANGCSSFPTFPLSMKAVCRAMKPIRGLDYLRPSAPRLLS